MACRTAADGFSDIVGKVGGEQEKARARFDCNAFTVQSCFNSLNYGSLTMSYLRPSIRFYTSYTVYFTVRGEWEYFVLLHCCLRLSFILCFLLSACLRMLWVVGQLFFPCKKEFPCRCICVVHLCFAVTFKISVGYG